MSYTYTQCKLYINIFFTVICRTGVQGDQHLTGHAGTDLNIFTILSMECDGLVTAWEFYALAAGDIYLGLWNYDTTANSATLTNKTKITVTVDQVDKSSVSICYYIYMCVCVCVCVCVFLQNKLKKR